jgi:hypothetical protein
MSPRLNFIRPAIVTPLAVSAGLGLGLAFGASAVAVSPAAASAIGVAITSVACSATSGCVVGTNSSTGPGVAGTSAKGTGVNGTSTSSYGLFGTSKSGVGVKAVSTSSSAIFATNDASNYATVNSVQTGSGPAMAATANEGPAIKATASDGDGLVADGQQDTGVVGTGLLQGGAFEGTTDAGVSGTTEGGMGSAGVYGYDDTSAGAGSYAVQGESPHNVAGSFLNDKGNKADVLDVQGGTTGAGNYLISAHSSDSSKYVSVDDHGDVYYTGDLEHETTCHGCQAGTSVRSYAPHESEPTMEDVGSGHLQSGSAYIALDPTFRNVVDAATDYHVLVTPEGDSNGIFVTARTNRGFFVHENHGGRSSVAFSYRIVAKPFGSVQPRLPTIRIVAQSAVHTARKPHRPSAR